MKAAAGRRDLLLLVLMLVMLAGLHALVNGPVTAPLIEADESSHLANAAGLAGFRPDGGNSHHAGYSLFLVPAFLLTDDPAVLYRYVQWTNTLLALAGVLVLVRVGERMFPTVSRGRILLAAGVAALYPAWFISGALAMSENALVPAFALALLSLLRLAAGSRRDWIFFALLLGLLFFIHPRTAPVILAGLIAGGLIAFRRREWGGYAALVVITIACVLLYKAALHPWLVERLTPGSHPPWIVYPGSGELASRLLSLEGLVQLSGRTAALLLYLTLATWGLLWAAVRWLAVSALPARHLDERAAPALFLLLALVGTVLMAALFLNTEAARRLDHWLYGRYLEGVLLPFIAIGLITLERRTLPAYAVLGGVCALLFAVTKQPTLPAVPTNMSGMWQHLLLPDWPVALWFVVSLLPAAGLLLLWRRPALVAAGTAALFLAVTWLGAARVLTPLGGGPHLEIPKQLRQQFPATVECVGLDHESIADPGRRRYLWAHYASYLFNYPFRRMTPQEWAAGCLGPLISFRRDLGQLIPDARLLAARQGGPYLWAREAEAPPGRPAPGRLPITAGEAGTERILGNGWHIAERWGVWSSTQAELWLPLPEACLEEGRCRVRLRFQAFAATAERPTTVRASWGAGPAAEWVVADKGAHEEQLQLPPPIGNRAEVRLALDIEGAGRPEHGGPGARQLGIGLLALWVEPSAPSR